MLRLVDPTVEMFPWHDNHRGDPANSLSQCLTLQAAVEQVAEIYEFQWHPYFIWMRSVGVNQLQFSRSQVPFQYAVESFGEAFTVVFERLAAPPRSIEIPAASTIVTATNSPRLAFQQCLRSLDARIDLSPACPIGLAAANRLVLNHCLTQPIAASAAMLGMIEYLYVDVSATLSQIIQHRGWAHQDSDFYYMIHGSLAINPSRDLFTLASATWDEPQARSQTARSLMLGAQYLWELYDGLYPEL
jgi:pyrroloquinoline-quinone synthase